jgi:hypothetical protein
MCGVMIIFQFLTQIVHVVNARLSCVQVLSESLLTDCHSQQRPAALTFIQEQKTAEKTLSLM